MPRQGPLSGLTVVELAALGPAPWCAMLLSDMGADVIRIDRTSEIADSASPARPIDFANRRGRRSVALDLKSAPGRDALLRIVDRADIFIEGNRPGVVEKLGIGPDICLARNPRLIYGRMTGWGQDGPMAHVPGHDLNYLALTGLLHAIGPAEGRPVVPLNLIADYGGGGMLLAFGLLCALAERASSGRGQVVDAAMVDGAALLGGLFYGWQQTGEWVEQRESNILDGGAPCYGTYETADGAWVAISANEPKFYAVLLRALELDAADLPDQHDRASWPAMRERFASAFRRHTRDEWVERMRSIETCFAPVLTLAEAMRHEHAVARSAFVSVDDVLQPAPAPRFSRTPGAVARPMAAPGEHSAEILAEYGFADDEIAVLVGQRRGG